MNKKIKKILDEMDLIVNHNKVPICFTQNQIKLLLDCITNLEKEIKELRETVDRLTNKEYKKDDSHLGIVRTKEQLERIQYLLCFKSKVEITDVLIDIEEKINKAIEYIQNRIEDINNGGNEHDYRNLNEILNILQGSDKE